MIEWTVNYFKYLNVNTEIFLASETAPAVFVMLNIKGQNLACAGEVSLQVSIELGCILRQIKG